MCSKPTIAPDALGTQRSAAMALSPITTAGVGGDTRVALTSGRAAAWSTVPTAAPVSPIVATTVASAAPSVSRRLMTVLR